MPVLPVLVALLGTLPLSIPASEEEDWIDLFLTGSRALEQGWLDEACRALEEALERLPEHAATAWMLAGANACAGDAETAFAWLDRAVEWGGGEAALLAWDPDLASLRADARFEDLLERLRERDAGRTFEPLRAELAWGGDSWVASVSTRAERIVSDGRSPMLHDLRARETLAILEQPGDHTTSTQISPDGRWVVTRGMVESSGPRRSFLRAFDATTGELVHERGDVELGPAVQFSRDGERMLIEDGGGVWRSRDWTLLAPSPTNAEDELFSPDGTRILLTSRANEPHLDATLWDVDRGAEVRRIRGLHAYTELGFSSDGARASVRDNQGRGLLVFDARSGEERCTIPPGPSPWRDACFLGAREIATLDEAPAVRIWDVRSGELLREFQVDGDPRRCRFDASAEGETLFVTCPSRSIEVFDSRSGKLLWSLHPVPDGSMQASFSPDGSYVIVVNSRGSDTVHDARSGEVRAMSAGSGLGTVASVRPGRDELCLGASDGSVRCIDARSGRTLGVGRHGDSPIRGLDFSPDGSRLAAIDREGILRVVDSQSMELSAAIRDACPAGIGWHLPHLQFSPDGRHLIVAGAEPVFRVYSTGSWQLSCSIAVDDVWRPWAWRADGGTLAVSTEEGRASTFSPSNGERLGEELHIEGDVYAMAFESSGSRLWVSSDRSTVAVFDTTSGALVRTLDLQDLDTFDSFELGSIAFRADGTLAITASSGFGVVAAWRPEDGTRLWSYEYSGGNPAELLSAFGTSGERVYVWGQGSWSPRIVDASSGSTLLDLAEHDLDELLPLRDERLVAATGSNGLEVIDARTGARRWSRVELASEGWILSSPSRHVDGTRAALEAVHLVLPERSYPLDALAAALLDPKKVRAAAEGVPIAPANLPAIPELGWVTPQLRVITLGANEPDRSVTLEARCPDGVAGFEMLVEGARSHIEGESVDATHRRLTLTVGDHEAPDSLDLRWRAISSTGVLGRALHLTIERAR